MAELTSRQVSAAALMQHLTRAKSPPSLAPWSVRRHRMPPGAEPLAAPRAPSHSQYRCGQQLAADHARLRIRRAAACTTTLITAALIRALTASPPKKITSPIQLEGRSTGEGMSDDHGKVMRIRKKLAARVLSSPANLFAAKNKRARWQRASDTPSRASCRRERGQNRMVTVAMSPVSRFSATRTDFLTGSR